MPVVRIRGLPVVAPSVTWTDVKASKELVRSARKICNNGQAVATPADMYVAQREVAFFRIGDGVVPKTQTQPPHVYTDSATTCCILVARTATHGVVTHLDSADCASRNLPGILSHLHQLSNTSTAPEPGPEHAKGSTPMPPVATSELSAVSVAPGGRKMEESEEEDEGDARMDVTATKAAAGAAAETEVYILGSYDDEKGESAALVQAVLRALHEQPVPVVLSEACCLELNTQTADTEGHKRAVITGAGVDTRCGAVVPMVGSDKATHVPMFVPRSCRVRPRNTRVCVCVSVCAVCVCALCSNLVVAHGFVDHGAMDSSS
mgnify:CR=1 FL=1